MSVQQVRDMIPDIEEIDWRDDGNPSYLFTDSQIQTYLDLNNGKVKRAVADAVEALATSEAYISKKIKTEDLETDGAAVANALLNRARQLRQSANDDEDRDDRSAFTLVRFRPRPPNYGYRRCL
jgi:hypothetical protein